MVPRLNEELLTEQAARLGAGGLRYTGRQLYYAVCQAVEPVPTPLGTAQTGCGVAMVVAGVVFGILFSIYIGLIVPVGMIVTGMGLQTRRAERNRPRTRPLAYSWDEFVRHGLDPHRGALPGLLGDEQLLPLAGVRADKAALVVTDHSEAAAVLRNNADAASLEIEVVAEEGLGNGVRGRRVWTLHDSDPQGCGLALRLRQAGAAEVVDIGIRPRHVAGRPVQVIEGAPVVVPGDLGGLLVPDEIVWLAEGKRVELAVLPPAALIATVKAAIDRAPVVPAAAEGILLSAIEPTGPVP